jgi:hypothetical protein
VKASSATLDKDEYELVLHHLQMNIPIAAIQALLEKRTDTNYSYVKQLKWFEAYNRREEQFTNQSKTLIKKSFARASSTHTVDD